MVLFLAIRAFAAADRSLDDARMAQQLLGPGIWSRVLRIENHNRRGPYPRTVHAVAFELAGILWFYTDCNGTQSLSLHRGRLAQEKADLKPLLLAIDPGFTRWTVLPDAAPNAAVRHSPLKNGCFIESVVLAQSLAVQRLRPRKTLLLSYYAAPNGEQPGHTVLACIEDHAIDVFDAEDPSSPRRLPLLARDNPLRLARAFAGAYVERARFLPLPDRPSGRGEGWAGAEAPSGTATRELRVGG